MIYDLACMDDEFIEEMNERSIFYEDDGDDGSTSGAEPDCCGMLDCRCAGGAVEITIKVPLGADGLGRFFSAIQEIVSCQGGVDQGVGCVSR